MAESIRNVGRLVSDYFLTNLLEEVFKEEVGRSSRRSAFATIKRMFNKALRALGEGSPAGRTRSYWLIPLFETLGFRLSQGEEIETEKRRLRPSHQYSPDVAGSPLVIMNLCAWGEDLDAPPRGAKRSAAPMRQMESMLLNSDARWGIVANGTTLRLLRQDTGGGERRYLEFRLDEMLLHEDELAFNIFYALVRKDAFVGVDGKEPLLDRVIGESERVGTAVGTALGESARRALEILCRGILEDEANKEILQNVGIGKVHREALYFLYRLFFIFYAESRELLPVTTSNLYYESYSLEAWRDRIYDEKEFSRTDYFVWESLKALFHLVRDGCDTPELFVPPYNGGLFSDRNAPLLEQIKVNDAVLRDCLLEISTTIPKKGKGRDRVSYRELDVAQIGAVYEGLLEYEPKIAEEDMVRTVEGGQWSVASGEAVSSDQWSVASEEKGKKLSTDHQALATEFIPKGSFYLAVWGGRRKGTGSYYTPEPITQFLVKEALDPLVQEKSPEEILGLKVLDPAMGSGAFLVAACRYVAERLLEGYFDRFTAVDSGEWPVTSEEEEKKLTTDHRPPATEPDIPKEVLRHLENEDLDQAEVACRRLVAEHCIYGVDLNPMAVELAKVSLWLTTLSSDRPLTFLDHRLRPGNSLIGADFQKTTQYNASTGAPATSKGKRLHAARQIEIIPEPALEEKGKETSKIAKEKAKENIRRNRNFLKGIAHRQILFPFMGIQNLNEVLSKIAAHRALMEEPEETPADVLKKERILLEDRSPGSDWDKLKQIADLWCSVWFWPASVVSSQGSGTSGIVESGQLPVTSEENKGKLSNDQCPPLPPNTDIYRELVRYIVEGECSLPEKERDRYLEIARNVAEREKFFHWQLEFPEVYLNDDGTPKENPGFDAVVGNPPWDIVKPNSQEFFSNYDPAFRTYPKQKAVKRIKELRENDRIDSAWGEYERRIECQSSYFRSSEEYPHLGKGDINTFKLFLERFHHLLKKGGNLSIIVPSGIYTDQGCQPLREYLLSSSSIRFLYSFENRKKIFPIDSRFKFVLLSVGKGGSTGAFRCCFLVGKDAVGNIVAPSVEELPRVLPQLRFRSIKVTRDQIERFSPDTLSIMEFKSQRDIDITEKIYDDHPLLGEHIEGTWNVKFTREFDMTNDSHLFVTREELEKMGARELPGWRWEREVEVASGQGSVVRKELYLPLYEGKMIWHFSHQFADPVYWVSEKAAQIEAGTNYHRHFRVGFRDTSASTNERTAVSSILPRTFHGNTVPSVAPHLSYRFGLKSYDAIYFSSVMNSFVFDFTMRQKVTTHLNFHYVLTMPVARNSSLGVARAIIARAARLICTTEDFADLWKEVYQPWWNYLGDQEPVNSGQLPVTSEEKEQILNTDHQSRTTDHRPLTTSLCPGWRDLTPEWTPKCGAYGWTEDKRDTGDRAQLRAEIDALVAHLYGLSYDDLAYILDTFPVLRENEIRAFGEYRSKRMCLEEYERLAPFIRQAVEIETQTGLRKAAEERKTFE